MATKPKLTAAEWRAIQRVLPPSSGVGRPRHGDREGIAVLLHHASQRGYYTPPLQGLVGRKAAASLVVKRARWQRGGRLAGDLASRTPAMRRWKEQDLRKSKHSEDAIAMLMSYWPNS